MTAAPRTRLTAEWVVGFDGHGHVLWPNGEVVFTGDRIEFVGRNFPGSADRTVDYGRALIGPGFIDLDALGDLDTTILTFDNGPDWTLGRVWSEEALKAGPEEAYTPDEELFQYRYAFAQLIRNGITTALPITSMLYRAWAESYDEFARVAALAGEMGIRAYLGPCFMSGLTYVRPDGSLHQHFDEAKGLAGLDDAVRFIRDFDGASGGRVRGFFAPDRIETQLPGVLSRLAAINRELNVPMRVHCCQSASEFETVLRLRGHSPLGWLEQLGLLNQQAILPHGIYLSGHPQVSILKVLPFRYAISGDQQINFPVLGHCLHRLAALGAWRKVGENILIAGFPEHRFRFAAARHQRRVDAQFLGERDKLFVEILGGIRKSSEDNSFAVGFARAVGCWVGRFFGEEFAKISKFGITGWGNSTCRNAQTVQQVTIRLQCHRPFLPLHVGKVEFQRPAYFKGSFQLLIALAFLRQVAFGQGRGFTRFICCNIAQSCINLVAKPRH